MSRIARSVIASAALVALAFGAGITADGETAHATVSANPLYCC